MSVTYEWDIELFDLEDEDVLDHHHESALRDFPPDDLRNALAGTQTEGRATRLVLVRDRGDDALGLISRQWAYVEDGALPDAFDGGAAIPKRFIAELRAIVH